MTPNLNSTVPADRCRSWPVYLAHLRLCILLLVTAASLQASFGEDTPSNPDLSEFFKGKNGCFVLYDSASDTSVRHNPKGCAERVSPCSTFKIPHTILALETGVATGPEFPLKWDRVKRSISAWNSNHTLRSALQNSVVWYYQELARRIGAEREAEFVRKLNYGNQDTTGGLTNFWLESSLQISADEQIDFLRALWSDQLPASRNNQRITRELMELSRSGNRTLYGKTGTGGDLKAGLARLGWFVGSVTRGDRTWFFATRLSDERDASGREARRITEAILEKLGI